MMWWSGGLFHVKHALLPSTVDFVLPLPLLPSSITLSCFTWNQPHGPRAKLHAPCLQRLNAARSLFPSRYRHSPA